MGKIKRIMSFMKRVIGIKISESCIVDKEKYIPMTSSTMGGRVTARNLLLVTNAIEKFTLLRAKLQEEGFCVDVELLPEQVRETKGVTQFEKYQVIVIALMPNRNTSFCEMIQNEYISTYYQQCQAAANYYIERSWKGRILNVILVPTDCRDNLVSIAVIRCMLEGLGLALGNHGIIVNGVIGEGIDQALCAWCAYLCGKFGDVLAGEVICLHNENY